MIRVLVCAAMAAARLVELGYSRRNLKRGHLLEGSGSRRTFPLIVLVHSAVLAGTALVGRGRSPRLPWLIALLAAQPIRLWVLLTLRERWNARGAVPESMQIAVDGPYEYVRHPNYSVVALELLSLPMAFGLGRLALAASVANAGLLWIRIRDEERLLFRLPGYAEHFERKPRFLPHLI
jgi:methyltransferase